MSAAEPDEFDPTQNATSKLMQHILEKGFQAGSCIGTGVVLPLTAYRGRRSGVPFTSRALRSLSKSAVVTTGITGLLGLGKIYGTPLTPEGIQDRVYRLHYNEGQNRTDTFARAGALTGAVVSRVRYGFGATSLIGGAALGTSLAVLAHVSTFQGAERGLKTGPSNMINELKHND